MYLRERGSARLIFPSSLRGLGKLCKFERKQNNKPTPVGYALLLLGLTLLALGFYVMLVRYARLWEHQGGAQPTGLFVAEVQVRPISHRRHAAGPQPARGASRSCQRVIRPQLLPGRSRCLFFLGAAHPATPLFLSTFHLPKKKAQF